MSVELQQRIKMNQTIRDKARIKKQELDRQKRENIVAHITYKEARSKRVLSALAKRDARECYRHSVLDRYVSRKLNADKYYNLPDSFKEALL